jgi:hypothetical protein
MNDNLHDIRRAQWRWDMTSADHGNSFHSLVQTGMWSCPDISIKEKEVLPGTVVSVRNKDGMQREDTYPH